MLFREVPDAVLTVLNSHPWLDEHREVTVVRALDGRVRVFVETDANHQRPLDAQLAALETDLRAAIGSWLGDERPVWARPRSGHDGIVAAIHAARKPWDVPTQRGVPLFRVERHAARHGWVGELPYNPPWTLEEADAGTHPPVVTFFSHKGGVGRTTALVAVAIHLAERDHKVLVIDLDLEAPGLGTLLAEPAPTEPGLLDLLVGPDDVVDAHLSAVATPHSATIAVNGPSIQVVKAGEVDDDYLDLLARLDLHGQRDVEDVTRRLRTVIQKLAADHSVDVVLLDARTGFHDVGGVALGALSHGAVFFGLSNEQSWQGLRAVARMLASAGYDDDDGKPKVWLQVVHALAPASGNDDEEETFKLRASDELAAHYYVEGHVPQDVSVLALPFREALRGAGDQLTSKALAVLREGPWNALAEAIAVRYTSLATEENY